MSRRDELSEKQWVAIADLGSTCHELLGARHDDEALTDGYVDAKCDELVALAKAAIRAARKLKKRAAGATEARAVEDTVEDEPEIEATSGG